MQDEIVTLTINTERIAASRKSTILLAAREHGIFIPTLCFVENVSSPGGCRLCLVEVEGKNMLQTACTTLVEEDMVVRTHSPRLAQYRKMIIELLLAEGNHVCSACIANGTCELQGLAEQLGVETVRFEFMYPGRRKDETHPRFSFDPNLCALCARCVRVCEEVEHAQTLDIAGKGIGSHLIMDLGDKWGLSSTCTSCGKCVTVCPTGALFEKDHSSAANLKRKSFLHYIEKDHR